MRKSLQIIVCSAAALLCPLLAVADDIEKLSAQNEYLISQVVGLRKKVKELELAETLLNQELTRERQRFAEESSNVRVLSQQVVELKVGAKKFEEGKAQADDQQKQLTESQARLSAESARLTGLVDDLTKQLQEKVAAQTKQQTEVQEIRDELDSTKRRYSKVNADLNQCGVDKQMAAADQSKLNEQLKTMQSSLATISDKDREIARLKNEVLLKDSLLNSLGGKPSAANAQSATSSGKPSRAMQEKRDDLFKKSGEEAGIETTGRKKINVPTGRGGDGVQVPSDAVTKAPGDMEPFGAIPSKGSTSRGGTVDRAFDKLKENLERQRGAAEVTPGVP